MVKSPQPDSHLIGWLILVTMLVAGILLLPIVIYQMGGNTMPEVGAVYWLPMCALVLAFPVMAAHLYVVVLSKRVGLFSFLLGLAIGTMALLFLLRQWFDESVSLQTVENTTFFFSCFIGGTLGGIAVFATVRRLIPRWLAIGEHESETFKKSDKRTVRLKTILAWMAVMAIIIAALADGQKLLLRSISDPEIYLWPLLAALVYALCCVFLVLPTCAWLSNARPLWLGKLSFITCTLLIPLSIFAGVSWSVGYLPIEHVEVAVYCGFFFCLSVLAVAWHAGCRWAGLVHLHRPPEPKKIFRGKTFWGYVSGGFSMIATVAQFLLYAITITFLLFAPAWLFVHASGREARNISVLEDKIHTLLNSPNSETHWIDVVNDQRSRGIATEDNVAVKIMKVSNPFRLIPNYGKGSESESYEFAPDPFGITHPEYYVEQLGLSLDDLQKMPCIDFHQWRDRLANQLLEDRYRVDAENGDRGDLGDSDRMMGSTIEQPELSAKSSDNDAMQSPESTGPIDADSDRYRYQQLRSLDPERLTEAPWTAADFPFAAQFIEEHDSQISELINISKESTYFSPVAPNIANASAFANYMLQSPQFLLVASGYQHIGNGNIDRAIENCEALWRLVKLTANGADTLCLYSETLRMTDQLATAVVFSGEASEAQMRRILKAWSMVDQDDDSIASILQLAEIQHYGKTSSTMTDPELWVPHPLGYSPISALYKSYPSMIDWKSFVAESERLLSAAEKNFRRMIHGEITHRKYRSISADLFATALPNGRMMGLEVYHGLLHRQLWVLAKGPQTKGRMLAQRNASAFRNDDFVYSINNIKRVTNRLAIALEIYKTKHSHYPNRLEDLSPDVLPGIDKDPATLSDMVYVNVPGDFTLYSAGTNEVDDGGDRDLDHVFQRPQFRSKRP